LCKIIPADEAGRKNKQMETLQMVAGWGVEEGRERGQEWEGWLTASLLSWLPLATGTAEYKASNIFVPGGLTLILSLH